LRAKRASRSRRSAKIRSGEVSASR